MRRLLLLSLFFIGSPVWADPVDVQIDRSADRHHLGVSPFVPEKATPPAFASDIKKTITEDLNFSKLFNLITEGKTVEKSKDAAEWLKAGSDSVLAATVRLRQDRLEISANLYDTRTAKELVSISRKGAAGDLRTLAHEVANEVVKYYTNQSGIFTSKIAFVNDTTGRKELYLSDYDGKNIKRVTNDNSIVILPRMSQDGKKMVFTSYRSGNPDLYVMNRDGTGRTKISGRSGLNMSPSWSPSGSEFAITLSMNGPPNIYMMDLQGKVVRTLTDAAGADTAPSFSPDGAQFVFTSDRSGSPHIYISNVDGTGVRRLTTTGHCDSAAWSPDGQTIVYVKGLGGGRFDIYSIEVLTGIERRLTWGQGNSENPAWSPDSRFIVFTTDRNRKYDLYVMSADGSDQRPLIVTKGQSFTPHWSN